MSAEGTWSLAPAFDVTWNEGPGGYHQMDIMGEALNINKQHLLWLGTQEADLSETQVNRLIASIADVASGFSVYAEALLPGKITRLPGIPCKSKLMPTSSSSVKARKSGAA